MPYPNIYGLDYSYTGFQQAQQGISAFPGTRLDNDLAGLRSSVSSLSLFMRSTLRSDGLLTNGSVGFDALSPALQTAGITAASAWITGVDYAVGAAVVFSETLYRCLVAHRSGVFATDLAAGKWAFVTAIFPNLVKRVYSSLADAAAAAILPNTNIVETLGRVAPGDNGGARYIRVGSTTPAAWRFQSADGQWWALADRFVTPEVFGAVTNTDCTAAFNALATWLNTAVEGKGGVIVNHLGRANYLIWPGATPPPAALVNLSGITGVTWLFNGSGISTANTSGAFSQQWVFNLANCADILVEGLNYTQTTWTTLDPSNNAIVFRVCDAAPPWSNNIHLSNLTVNGASAAFQVACGVLVDGNVAGADTHDLSITNAEITNTYYGMSFQGAGDNFFARNVRFSNTGRAYFPWNVSGHDVQFIGDGGGPFDQALLEVYGLPAGSVARNALADIKIKYRNSGRINSSVSQSLISLATNQFVPPPTISNVANNGAGLMRLTLSSAVNVETGQRWYVNGIVGSGNVSALNGRTFTATRIDSTHIDLQGTTFGGTYTSGGYVSVPVQMKNIDIEIDGVVTATGQPSAVHTVHADGVDPNGTVPLGVTIDNIKIRGTLTGWTAASGIPALNLFTNTGGSGGSFGVWTGETIRNVSVSGLVISDDATVLLNTSPMTTPMVLENISAPGTAWTVTGANYRQQNVQVASGLSDARSVIPSAASANQFATGVGADGALTYAQPAIAGIANLAAGVAAFLTTPSSANFKTAVTDEVGTGSVVFGTLGTAAGNIPVLDGSGLLDTSILPALAISDVNVVASQVAMLALTAQRGDIAVRSDLNKSYVLSTNSPSTLADWKELLTPTDAVLSVAGLTGAISAAALKTALAIALADITDASANGRSLVAAANYAAMRTLLAMTLADITDASANGRSLVGAANYAAMRTLLAMTLADITDASANGRSLVGAANYAAMRTLLGLVVGTDVQAYDAELAAIAGLVSAANRIPYFTGSGTASQLTLDTDGTLAANSDTVVATQKAVKTAINALIGANDVEVYKGVIDCSANPNYPLADAGHVYRVSVAGKIGGASGVNVEIGDRLQCIVDGTAAGTQASVGANWWITQTNVDFSANGVSLITAANYAAMRSLLGLVIGTDVQAYDGSAWTTSTPAAPTSSGGAFTSASATMRYKQNGKRCVVQGSATITTVGGVASGHIIVTLPIAAAAFDQTGVCGERNVVGNMGQATLAASSTSLHLFKYEGSTLISAGVVVNFYIDYETV